MVLEQVRRQKTYTLPLDELRKVAPHISYASAPTITNDLAPIEVCQLIGDWYKNLSSEAHRHDAGQFFTPPIVARYMANLVGAMHNQMRVLDPGAGVGMLACAVCELAKAQQLPELTVIAYEYDPILFILCSFTLEYARDFLSQYGVKLSIELHQQDFLEAMAAQLTHHSLWSSDLQPEQPFDLAIFNPPYFKVNQTDSRAKLVKDFAHGRTNMYTMFMSLAASTLRIGARFISITPRSFASGTYFKQFRQQFFNTITPELIHLFDSRRSAFEDADVLQENIILSGVKKGLTTTNEFYVSISRSRGINDLTHPLIQQLQRSLIIDSKQQDPVLHLPTSDIDIHLLEAFRHWNNRLATFGLEISTGPVVPFRVQDMLTSVETVEDGKAVPLLWLQHVHRMDIKWPLANFDKPQGVFRETDQKLLVRNTTQILLRRFSAKEEARRITAAVLPEGMFETNLIALENHLNYLYRPGGTLSIEEATGIAAFLNCSLVDRYFRIGNGNTQVNATELRKLPLPQFEQARLVDRNPDDPTRPTNSPNTCYALTEEVCAVLCQFETPSWEGAVTSFLALHGALWEHYQRSRQAVALPLTLADGKQIYLTPGKHNKLQIAVIEAFGPRFVSGSIILYLIEAVTSHGPITHKRLFEFEKLLRNCIPKRVYVSAFLDFSEFGRHKSKIAWETEVWIAEIPEHMIHYNGDRYIGQHG